MKRVEMDVCDLWSVAKLRNSREKRPRSLISRQANHAIDGSLDGLCVDA